MYLCRVAVSDRLPDLDLGRPLLGQYGAIHGAKAGEAAGGAAGEGGETIRAIYVIDPERKLQLHLTYPVAVGRNFFEVLRVLDSLQITSYHQVGFECRLASPRCSQSMRGTY